MLSFRPLDRRSEARFREVIDAAIYLTVGQAPEMKSCWNQQEHEPPVWAGSYKDQRQRAKICFGRWMITFLGSLKNYGRDDIDP